MDTTQLRYPVVLWNGRTPLHSIRALCLAFPQSSTSRAGAGPAGSLALLRPPEDGDTDSKAKNATVPQQPPALNKASSRASGASANASSSSSSSAFVSADANNAAMQLCPHPPHAFVLTGSQTGELAHWFIPSYRTADNKKRQCGSNAAIPRALLLRQGSACCTAVCYCRDGLQQLFCAGTSEGFLTLWSARGARCVRSELVLPFAPSQILFYQRYNPLVHTPQRSKASNAALGAPPSANASASPSAASASSSASTPTSPASASSRSQRSSTAPMHNYLLCCSEDSRDVFVVELPSLCVLALLQHRAPVRAMALVPPTCTVPLARGLAPARTPFLVTVTTAVSGSGQAQSLAQVSLWDLSGLERKYDEKKRAKLAAASGANHSRNTYSTFVSRHLEPNLMPPLPSSSNLSNPVSSLASHSASIITPGSSSGGSSGSSQRDCNVPPGAVPGIVLKLDDPAHQFFVGLPPAPVPPSIGALLAQPLCVALSPCGRRGVLVFPYAIALMDMQSAEASGQVISMGAMIGALKRQQHQRQVESSTSPLRQQPLHAHAAVWNERELSTVLSHHAPFNGAGFLTVPLVSTSSGNAGPGAADSAASSTQYLVLWSSSGEFVLVLSLSEEGTDSQDSNSTAATATVLAQASRDESSLSLSRGSGAATKSNPHVTPPKLQSFESPDGAGAARRRNRGPRVQLALVARCCFSAPKTNPKKKAQPQEMKTNLLATEEEDEDDEFVLSRPGAVNTSALVAATTSSSHSSDSIVVPHASIAVYVSGHTVFAGTEEGSIVQWHIPLCTRPDLFTSGVAHIFPPTHTSRLNDAFASEAAGGGATASTPGGQNADGQLQSPTRPSKAPVFTRYASLPDSPSARSSAADGAADGLASFGPLPPPDPPTASTLLIDPLHEALLLAVGHASGCLRVYNVLSKARAHLELSARHGGAVTALLALPPPTPWGDACIMATAGLDGRVHIVEMSSGILQATLHCPAPVLSLHKPSATAEDGLGAHFRGSAASLLFVNSADRSLRAFSLSECGAGGGSSGVVFVAAGLDAPVRAIYRPAWALAADVLLTLTRSGAVYVHALSSGHLLQRLDAASGASSFLQRHDLIVPASQLSILAHRLHALRGMRRKAARDREAAGGGGADDRDSSSSISAGSGTPPSLSRSGSRDNLRSVSLREARDLPAITVFASGEGEGATEGASTEGGTRITIDEAHFSPTPASAAAAAQRDANSQLAGGITSYENNQLAPVPLSRARSSVSIPVRRSSLPASTLATSSAASPALQRLASRGGGGGGRQLLDAAFQRDVFRLNLQHQQAEREDLEAKRLHAQLAHHSHTSAGAGHHYSQLNPPVPAVGAKPLHHSHSNIINPQAAAAQHHPPAPLHPPAGAQPHKPSSSPAPPGAGGSNVPPSPSPPLTHPAAQHQQHQRSPIAAVDLVSSLGSTCSPLSHLHANVYVWNVHAVLPFLSAHSAALVTMAKRAQALAAAKADPTNAALQAAAHAARTTNIPSAFYILCGLLSTLFDWHADAVTNLPAVEGQLRSELRCYPPSPAMCFASLSDNSQALTLLFPCQSHAHRRWLFDADLTARHSMAISAVLQTLLEKSDPTAQPMAAPWFASALHHYQSTIPKQLSLYAEPDINVLAHFALNLHRPVASAARTLLQQALERCSGASRLSLAEEKGAFYDYALPPQRMVFQPEFNLSPSELVASGSIMAVCDNSAGMGFVSDEEMMVAAVLSWVGLFEMREQRKAMLLPSTGSGASEGISEFQAKSQYITNTLLRMIAWPVGTELENVKSALACDLLARGLLVFRHHITEPVLMMRRLFNLSLHSSDALARAARHALLDSGKIAPTHFISCMGKEALSVRNSPSTRQEALMSIVGLIKKHPNALALSLPAAVHMIVNALDPSEPTLRKTLLQASTTSLYALATRYPQVSFHQPSQRYAVATATGVHSVIIVYDLRTATKWRILEGHAGNIHAVAFHPKGLSLASYSATENPPSVRVWSTGAGGFFSGLLGMEGKCTHSWPMLPCVKPAVLQVATHAAFAQIKVSSSTTKKVSAASATPSTSSAREPSTSAAAVSTGDTSTTEEGDVDVRNVVSNTGREEDDDEDEEDESGIRDAEAAADEPAEDDDDGTPQSLAPKTRPASNSSAAVSSNSSSSSSSAAASAAAQPSSSSSSSRAAAGAGGGRFTLDELLSVKIMWVSDKALKLKREDGSMVDFHLG